MSVDHNLTKTEAKENRTIKKEKRLDQTFLNNRLLAQLRPMPVREQLAATPPWTQH